MDAINDAPESDAETEVNLHKQHHHMMHASWLKPPESSAGTSYTSSNIDRDDTDNAAMSKLPRLRSSSPDRVHSMGDAGPSMPSRATNSLKRKSVIEEEDEEAQDQPRKLPAIGASRPNRPLQPSRTAANSTAARGAPLPKPLTKPKAPALTRSTRGTSAPPTNARPPSRTNTTRATTGRVVSGSGPSRVAAGPSRPSDDKRFNDLQSQLTSIETARAADAARLASDMEAERNKVAELQANHMALSRELATAKSQELNQRRELVHASDEIENLKKKHAREVMDLEMDIKKRDREIREVNEDLRVCRSDLERERETVSSLKNTISHQSTSHLTLTTQNHALEAQSNALQSQIDAYARTVSDLTLKLESTQKHVDDLKKEAMDSELIRRKLHNMVQELKGNIRVFCRVRPVLPSDLTTYTSTLSSSASSSGSESGSVDLERSKEELQANFVFPDTRDHKEIVVSSSSSSATGQERKEVYNFSFDQVIMTNFFVCSEQDLNSLSRYSSLSLPNWRCSKRFRSWHKAAQMDITFVFLLMVRLAPESRLRWRVAWCVPLSAYFSTFSNKDIRPTPLLV